MKNYQFYHIYPLGMLNKLSANWKTYDRTIHSLHPGENIRYMNRFIDHLKKLHINGVYVGPVFESVYHGYDTVDYTRLDPRLGSNEDFRAVVGRYHAAGMDIILDCVFNHVSRRFFAFQDVLANREQSKYRDWFHVDFSLDNHHQDGFCYETWDGHDELVKLNLTNKEVRDYLIDIARGWVNEFDIDGLRLDAADVMDRDFIRALTESLRDIKPEFYMVGEMVHGDYAGLIRETGIDSVTNYESYKGLYSSLNDSNYFEIAYSLNRLFGEGGLIHDGYLYNFADNHDVNRVASDLGDEGHLHPLYIMLYTIKGFPSLYYKSEMGAKGKRDSNTDVWLREPFAVEEIDEENPLLHTIRKLSEIRTSHDVLCYGDYEELIVESKTIGYRRYDGDKSCIVLLNSDDEAREIDGHLLSYWKARYNVMGYDVLNEEGISMSR